MNTNLFGFIKAIVARIFTAIMMTIGVCVLSSCAGSDPVEVKKVEEPQRDRIVARVASVNTVANYVLIQRYGRLVIPENSILYTLSSRAGSADNPASIKVTGERLGQFLAADIISGQLAVGDSVYLRILEE